MRILNIYYRNLQSVQWLVWKHFWQIKLDIGAHAQYKYKSYDLNLKQVLVYFCLQMKRFNRQRVLAVQSSLINFADTRIKNGRDTNAILAKFLNDVKKLGDS